jgi:hypothetical protein
LAESTRTRNNASTNAPVAISPQQVHSYPVPGLDKLSIAGYKIDQSAGPTERDNELAFLTLARDRFKLCADAEVNRRREALEDLRFRCGHQWRPDIKAKRESKGRPCHEINRIPEFLMHVVNNMRQGRPAIEIDPVGDGADQEQAEIRQGLIQFIERNSQADIAYDHSFEQMCTMGLGWIRVLDDWSDWDSFDKDLFIRWVENAFQVYSDPTAALPDWSDMQYAFVVEDMLPNEFKVRYGDEYYAAQPNVFQGQGDIAKYWFPGQKIRVAEYFYIEHTKDTLCELSPGMTALLSELNKKSEDGEKMFVSKGDRLYAVKYPDEGWEDPTYEDIGRTRECTVPVVKWCKITGLDVLERRTWKGKYIPLIPVIGNQVMLEGEKLLFGMVRFAREIQRMYNYIYSTLIEVIALAPRSQWTAAMGQIEEFRDLYERSNTDPVVVLPYTMTYTPQGQPLPPPQRVGTEVAIQGLIEALQVVDNMLKSVFMIYDASLGQRGPQESGLAINARKVESETATYNWGDNFIRALRQLGIVVNDLLAPYYNTPGRIVQILREDQTTNPVTFNQEYTPEGKSEPVTYDLSKGKYAVAVSTGPSYLTLRKEAATQMTELFKANPQLFPILGDLYVDQQDWPNKAAWVSRLKKTLPPALQDNQQQQQASPEMLQQLQGMVQQLTVALHEATDKTELQRMKEEFATIRTTITAQAGIIEQMLKSGSQEGMLLANKSFEEAERRFQMEQGLDQPGGGTPPASGAPGQQPVQSGAPQPSLAGQPTGG